ncbi:DNA primase [Plantactinospora sp. KBS50]|uniref:DNA primase n=1 Tax=Plantactinospora sp. KBS50 TaxID=2024580 RepID=UPI000BAB051C|nr:DNA primase [Plantactinospora sp. KBS50]ASW57990.1 DNA primase [Plantactinospora sp. KBS50]
MARQSSPRPDADEPDNAPAGSGSAVDPAEADATEPVETAGTEPTEAADAESDEPAEAADAESDRSLWAEVDISPVEIALPSGSGFTLRAYRMSDALIPTDISDRDLDDPFEARRRAAVLADADTVLLDEEFAEQLAEAEDRPARSGRRRGADADGDADEDADASATDLADDDEALADEEELPAEEPAEEPEPEEVPMFLTHRGKLLLFKTPESLVEFVSSGAPNDLAQLDTWDELVRRLTPADVAPTDDDSYELDLVVENLRGGHDVWDAPLLIKAGEVARDLAYALRLPPVLDMLSSGTSLDDLDEALRSSVNGGLGGFRGRRRLRKIGAQTASLGWRTIIGKISAAVDWRD